MKWMNETLERIYELRKIIHEYLRKFMKSLRSMWNPQENNDTLKADYEIRKEIDTILKEIYETHNKTSKAYRKSAKS